MAVHSWKLNPSDFAFLWEECKRCFYLKVVHNYGRPSMPFPKIFTKIHPSLDQYFNGRSTIEMSSELPPGMIVYGEKWVQSTLISLPNHKTTCYIVGKFDTAVQFEDGTWGVVDFKTAESKSEHIPLYSRQLHAYAHALENAAPGKISLKPVSKLGLYCLEPSAFGLNPSGGFGYRCGGTWLECQRDDSSFMALVDEILAVLELLQPPPGSASCSFCQYRDTARRTGL